MITWKPISEFVPATAEELAVRPWPRQVSEYLTWSDGMDEDPDRPALMSRFELSYLRGVVTHFAKINPPMPSASSSSPSDTP